MRLGCLPSRRPVQSGGSTSTQSDNVANLNVPVRPASVSGLDLLRSSVYVTGNINVNVNREFLASLYKQPKLLQSPRERITQI